MIKVTKEDVVELVKILETFSEASGMKINWKKPSAYWYDRFTHKPEWFVSYNWIWAEKCDIYKFSGTASGLNLETKDVDQILYNKIAKKLI